MSPWQYTIFIVYQIKCRVIDWHVVFICRDQRQTRKRRVTWRDVTRRDVTWRISEPSASRNLCTDRPSSVTLFSGARSFSKRGGSFFLSRNVIQFTEHKSTLSCPRESVIFLCSEPAQSRTHTQAPFPYHTYRILPSSVPLKIPLYMTTSVFAFASTTT